MIKLYHYNGTKLKDFYMGPSVKFVLPIIDAFPDKIMEVIFLWQKRTNREGGGDKGCAVRFVDYIVNSSTIIGEISQDNPQILSPQT